MKWRKQCKKQQIQLNKSKSVIKMHEIKFMGHLISETDIEPDPCKVEAIKHMQSRSDVSRMKGLCGMVQDLARFFTKTANSESLQKFTRKNKKWTKDCEKAVQTIKDKISNAPVFTFINSNENLTLQVACR